MAFFGSKGLWHMNCLGVACEFKGFCLVSVNYFQAFLSRIFGRFFAVWSLQGRGHDGLLTFDLCFILLRSYASLLLGALEHVHTPPMCTTCIHLSCV